MVLMPTNNFFEPSYLSMGKSMQTILDTEFFMSEVRVRFAPSPTGNVHIGNIRAAIFNWLYARHMGGKFLLRVEDTDKERSTQSAVDALLECMEWLGLDYLPLYLLVPSSLS